jgi:hypothetical protein
MLFTGSVMNRMQVFGCVLAAVLAGCTSTPSGRVRIEGFSPETCQASWNIVSCPDEQHRKVLRN